MRKGKKVKVDYDNPKIYDGTKVYLKEGYSKGVKYCVADLGGNHYLIADNKMDFNDGRGYIYHLSAIEYRMDYGY